MDTMASQITSLTTVYSTVYSGADQRKHESSASLAFVRGIHRSPVNSPDKGPVTRKMFPFYDVIMYTYGTGNEGLTSYRVGMVIFPSTSPGFVPGKAHKKGRQHPYGLASKNSNTHKAHRSRNNIPVKQKTLALAGVRVIDDR